MILIKVALFRICCTLSWRPYKSRKLNLLEICNDSAILVCVYIIHQLCDLAIPDDPMNGMSIVLIVNCLINITIHLSVNFNEVIVRVKNIYYNF